MSINKAVRLGFLGNLIMIVGTFLEVLYRVKPHNINMFTLYSVFLIASLFMFASFYKCFEFTEVSSTSCRINIIGAFSFIPMIAYNVFGMFEYLFPNIAVLYTTITLFSIAYIVSNILMLIFFFSIYFRRITNNLNKPIYKIFLGSNIVYFLTLSIYNFNCINNIITPFSIALPGYVSISSLAFKVIFFITYKNFLLELIEITKFTTDTNPIESYSIQ